MEMNRRNSLMRLISLNFKKGEKVVSMIVNMRIGIIKINSRQRNFQNELITYFVRIRLVRKRKLQLIKILILFILVRVS
jgi:hypothetical protein